MTEKETCQFCAEECEPTILDTICDECADEMSELERSQYTFV